MIPERTRLWWTLFLCIASVTCAGTCTTDLEAAEKKRAFVNAKLLPIDGAEIAEGTLLIEGSRIIAIGPRDQVVIPADAETIDCTGKVLMPGLICTHSHIGGVGAADSSGPIQPGVRVGDSINVRDSGFKRALAGGLTTLNIMPGSGHLISGQTVYVKLRFGDGIPASVDSIAYRRDDGQWLGGLKMANGTNSMKEPPFPQTRGKSAFLVREQYIKAREYMAKVRAASGDMTKLPARDLHLECLAEAMEGRRIVHHHTHRHDDIMTVLRLAEEFGFRVVLHHVSEGWKVADQIAAAGAPCSIILVDSPGGKLEAKNLILRNGKVLEDAGVKVAFHTDDWITDSRYFFRMAALGVRAGMSREVALRGLTLSGAEMLDLDRQVGSLTPGKDADFIVLSGDPLSIYSKVEQTWVEGKVAFDRSNPSDRLYAVGGFGAGHDQSPYFCCFGQ
ncbi:MAG: amidohydrolase family protein [Planctomyces sp.]|nr:amidohydrolase family protein [Planctomyces sp.]